MEGIVKTPFKLTNEEILFSAASTLCLTQLIKTGTQVDLVEEMCFPSQYGFTASATLEPCGPRFVRITDIKGGKIDWQSVPFCACPNSDPYKLAANDILIARAGSIGKSFIVQDVPEPSVFASYMIRLRTKEEIIPQYLYWCFQSQQFWQQIMEAHRGSAMKNINSKMLADLKFPNPPQQIQEVIVLFLEGFKEKIRGVRRDLPELQQPLREVKAIVARIEELAAKVEEARGLRREAVGEIRRLTPSVVAQTLADRLDDAKVVTVADIARSVTDGDHLPPPKSDSGEIPFIFISNVVEGKLIFSNCKWVSQQYFNSLAPSRVAKKGDVLYTAVGSYGIPCLVDTDEPFCFQRHIAIIKPNQDLILSKYLIWALSSSDVINQATQAATGSAQLTVPLRDIRKLKFLLPPLPEQRRIVTYLDDLQANVDAVKQLQAETQAELDALLPSILDKAFRGELV